ncbi:hypothetical protein OU5_1471 [Pseudomonas mandelii JR-1]|uniref:Uncharacterized protein n=1 Tax=Pseudomonas mandelii JR-1 TaxID=1147786 RepID=A0A024E7J0_9PSED|nr:hypothetical protein OU5_1471 [Pseudomonas mandelii JR-1]
MTLVIKATHRVGIDVFVVESSCWRHGKARSGSRVKGV